VLVTTFVGRRVSRLPGPSEESLDRPRCTTSASRKVRAFTGSRRFVPRAGLLAGCGRQHRLSIVRFRCQRKRPRSARPGNRRGRGPHRRRDPTGRGYRLSARRRTRKSQASIAGARDPSGSGGTIQTERVQPGRCETNPCSIGAAGRSQNRKKPTTTMARETRTGSSVAAWRADMKTSCRLPAGSVLARLVARGTVPEPTRATYDAGGTAIRADSSAPHTSRSTKRSYTA